MDIINDIGPSAYLTFDLYLDDKLYAIFKYTLTEAKNMNDKHISLCGSVDREGLFRGNKLRLVYDTTKGTFKRLSRNTAYNYKFVLNTNTKNSTGSHNTSVMERLLKKL